MSVEGPAWELEMELPVLPGAACKDHVEPWLWDDRLDGEHDRDRRRRHRRARDVCAGCPILRECFSAASEYGGVGIWAGTLFTGAEPSNADSDEPDVLRAWSVIQGYSPGDGLSKGERAAVVSHLASRGKPDVEIAEVLGISERHVGRIRADRGIRSGRLGVSA